MTSTLLEDRRDACRALKSLSRKYRIEVGAQGMPCLIQILEMDRSDCEIIGYALETLCNVTSQEQFDEEVDNPTVSANVGEQFTEMFIKSPENVTTVLSLLEEFDFKVRWPAIKLLTALLVNRHKDIQEIILVSPMAVSKLMDLLMDTREVIRNDALLLLIQLIKGNANLQKIVAFENAFDRLFDVIRDEGFSDGGIVVEDCLIVMINLLKNNSSNQQFFKEGSFIQRLAPMLVLPPELDEMGWTPQKLSNIHCMLQIVRSLVNPSNSQIIVQSSQMTMRNCGLLETLCKILMGSGVPADILTETINTVGEVIRGDLENQEYLNSILAPSNPPQPAIVVLLMSMVNEKQPLLLRCAVLYCFQCFLYRNAIGQAKLVQTLLPSSSTVQTLTAGQLLCGGLFSNDALANWFSLASIMHALIENTAQKEQLLRVLLATSAGSQPVSLLQQCTTLLQQGNYKLQAKIGILMLLSTWLCDCQLAVKTFLATPNTIPFLIAQIGANEHDDNEYLVQSLCAFVMGICIQFNDNTVPNYRRDDLCQLISKRIGLEMFTKKLGEVSKHEAYSRAAKLPQIRVKSGSELLLDYEFCKLLKTLEGKIGLNILLLSILLTPYHFHCIGVIIKNFTTLDNANNSSDLSINQNATGVISQYKDIIRDQDYKLQTLKIALKKSEQEMESMKKQLNDLQQTNAQLFDQNILLKAQLAATTSNVTIATKVKSDANSNANANNPVSASTELSFYQLENGRLLDEVQSLNTKLNEALEMTEQSLNLSEVGRLRKDQEDLLELLTDQVSLLFSLKRF